MEADGESARRSVQWIRKTRGVTLSDGRYQAHGWALVVDRNEPADAVVVAAQRPDGCCTVVAIADERVAQPAFRHLGRRSLAMSGWRVAFDPQRVPADATRIRAWAYDALAGRATELAGQFALDPVPSGR